MDVHCHQLRLVCLPVATLREVLRESSGIDLRPPSAPVPATEDYEAELAPSVRGQVQDLDARVQAAPADGRVAELVQEARDRLAVAQAALEERKYYLAATRSFQGSISIGQAEAIAAFYAGGGRGDVVQAWLDRCADASRKAQEATEGLEVGGLNHLLAAGAAQQRSAEAADLHGQAESAYRAGVFRNDWIGSLQASVFCVERAGTAHWWASLRDAYGPGPAVPDLEGLALAQLESAQEMVTYAQAVQGDAGAAASQLEAARTHLEEGRPAAAIVDAVGAASAASVALQAPQGKVPLSVLEAARQGASAAVAQARAAGAEPVLAVSLVELAGHQEGEDVELANLWTARALALLDGSSSAPEVEVHRRTAADGDIRPALFVGALLGACAVALALAIIPPWGRRR